MNCGALMSSSREFQEKGSSSQAYLLTVEVPHGCVLCALSLSVHLSHGCPAAAWFHLFQCCQGCLVPNWNDMFFPPRGPAITCGGGSNVKANVFLMFLSFKRRGEILNGSQQTDLLSQPPRIPHYPARHLVLSPSCIRLGEIS